MRTFEKLALLAAAPFCFASCESSDRSDDLAFARSTFQSLVRGESDVRDDIDWETLRAFGDNVGAQYVVISSETEREAFETAFITQFAASFRDSGGNVDAFTNWRVTGHADGRTEISADSPNGVLRLTVTERDDEERLSRLEVVP